MLVAVVLPEFWDRVCLFFSLFVTISRKKSWISNFTTWNWVSFLWVQATIAIFKAWSYFGRNFFGISCRKAGGSQGKYSSTTMDHDCRACSTLLKRCKELGSVTPAATSPEIHKGGRPYILGFFSRSISYTKEIGVNWSLAKPYIIQTHCHTNQHPTLGLNSSRPSRRMPVKSLRPRRPRHWQHTVVARRGSVTLCPRPHATYSLTAVQWCHPWWVCLTKRMLKVIAWKNC